MTVGDEESTKKPFLCDPEGLTQNLMFTTDLFDSLSSIKLVCNCAGKNIDVMALGQQNRPRDERFCVEVLKSG